MQGIKIEGQWASSKKAVREALGVDPSKVEAIATSIFGDEFNGPVDRMKPGQVIHFVGPDPENSRRFYGSIKKVDGGYEIK